MNKDTAHIDCSEQLAGRVKNEESVDDDVEAQKNKQEERRGSSTFSNELCSFAGPRRASAGPRHALREEAADSLVAPTRATRRADSPVRVLERTTTATSIDEAASLHSHPDDFAEEFPDEFPEEFPVEEFAGPTHDAVEEFNDEFPAEEVPDTPPPRPLTPPRGRQGEDTKQKERSRRCTIVMLDGPEEMLDGPEEYPVENPTRRDDQLIKDDKKKHKVQWCGTTADVPEEILDDTGPSIDTKDTKESKRPLMERVRGWFPRQKSDDAAAAEEVADPPAARVRPLRRRDHYRAPVAEPVPGAFRANGDYTSFVMTSSANFRPDDESDDEIDDDPVVEIPDTYQAVATLTPADRPTGDPELIPQLVAAVEGVGHSTRRKPKLTLKAIAFFVGTVILIVWTVVGLTLNLTMRDRGGDAASISPAPSQSPGPTQSTAPSLMPSKSMTPSLKPSSGPTGSAIPSVAPSSPPPGDPTQSAWPTPVPSLSIVPSLAPSAAPTTKFACQWPDEFRGCGDSFIVEGLLNGTIPTTFESAVQLRVLDLSSTDPSSTQLSGTIPPELKSLTGLTELNLADNALIRTIPIEFSLLTNLESLWLHNNQLTGSIPSELGLLTRLTKLWAFNNQFTGTIPTEIKFVRLANI